MLQRPATLLATDDNEAQEMDKALKSGGNVMKALSDVREQRAEALRKRLEAMSKRKAREVNAMELFLAMGRLDLAEYEPLCAWQRAPITEGQTKFLSEVGFDLDSVKDKGMATCIINAIMQRRDGGMATLKMAKFARTLGLQDAFTRKFEEVKEFLDCYQSNKDYWANIPD